MSMHVSTVNAWACYESWMPLWSTLCCRPMHMSTKSLCPPSKESFPEHKSGSRQSEDPSFGKFFPLAFIAENGKIMPLTTFEMCPRQWSWPINFPLPLLGIFGAKTLHNGAPDLPWADELEHTSLSEYIGIAPYSEVHILKTVLFTNGL